MNLLLVALITVIPAQQRLGKKITVLVDTSSSMMPHYRKALESASFILQQTAVDHVEVKLRTFGHESKSTDWFDWPLPLPRMMRWLAENGANPGNITMIDEALAAALAEGDVIIVSDFDIHDLKKVKKVEGRVIACVLVGALVKKCLDNATALQQKGGVYRETSSQVLPDPDDFDWLDDW